MLDVPFGQSQVRRGIPCAWEHGAQRLFERDVRVAHDHARRPVQGGQELDPARA
jgi:hypothetical protein